ncbi:hypothetical protein C9374_005995 [Naegleria lovaniensis]|uniref:CLAC channel n=1 Tax=Naegleria lovaniensis TaxID=51637 RepID=A0AA88GM23_NAELO|nr:uncharacterized protein C9374_014213 [Naegleria lovaniensis]XP_044547291.1 uncharacterized protein C9374_005995 [Naegleria lovaniensis]KAG2370798.1 hypothetical protein C9374_014213 [Naegleria lovaniensis]KAG2381611.1 hypothetical protein C9374_005995 [Naegleria lovaniensis]
MNIFYACVVMMVALCTSLLTTFVEWIFVYRKSEYQELQDDIDQIQKRIDKIKKETIVVHKGGSINNSKEDQKAIKRKKDNLTREKEQLRAKNQELSMFKMKSTIIVGIIMISVFGLLNNVFDGRIVAKLPFEPFSIFHMFTHRNIPGSDFRDCGMLFIYILASNSFKTSIQKFFGFVDKSQSMFQMPEVEEDEQ